MSTAAHPYAQLSAYLDGALGPAERGAIEAHLAGCADCRSRLEQLRATAALIAALPDLRPTRRLTPRLATPPAWLAPLRTLSTLASGLSVFLFIASALLANMGQPSASGTAAVPAAAPAAGRAESSAAPTAGGLGAAPPQPQPSAGEQRSATSDSAAKSASQAPGASAFAVAPASSAPARDASAEEVRRTSAPPALGPSPWIWLALAVVTGAIALALQRRLRSA